MNQPLVKFTLLVFLGLFLATRLINDVILLYISERFVTLTFLAGVGLVVIAGGYLLAQQTDDHDHEHNHNCACEADGHAHGHPPTDTHGAHPSEAHSHVQLTWLGGVILCLPLLLGLIIPPQPLGANALANREVNMGQPTAVGRYASTNLQIELPAAPERTILEWLIAFDEKGFTQAAQDGPAKVVGFVYRDERFGEAQFLVSRYVVSCCVADATPVGLIVDWGNTAVLTSDSWVEVEGRFVMGEFGGQEVPILRATRVTAVEQPTPVYLYELLAGQ